METIKAPSNNNDDPYFYYHNWVSQEKTFIHRASCHFCRDGKGFRDNIRRGHDGVWIGPFDNLEWAKKYVETKLNMPPLVHDCPTSK